MPLPLAVFADIPADRLQQARDGLAREAGVSVPGTGFASKNQPLRWVALRTPALPATPTKPINIKA